MWTTIYFWGLTGIALLAWVLYFLPIWGSGESEEREGCFYIGLVATVLLVISTGVGFLFDISNRYPGNSPVNSPSMTTSLLRSVHHNNPNLVSESGRLTTYTGSYYFLKNKDDKLQVYYLARNDGVAFYTPDTRSQTLELVDECIQDAYPPACSRLLSNHTYRTVATFWLPTRTTLQVYPKPRPLP